MKLKLEVANLEKIVRDSVQGIFIDLNISRKSKRSQWYKNLAEKLRHYEKALLDIYLPVVIKDFSGTVSVKLIGGKLDQDGIKSLLEFKTMVEKSFDHQYKEDLKNEMRAAVDQNTSTAIEDWIQIVDKAHNEMMMNLELKIRSIIFEDVEKKAVEKSKLMSKIYNFTDVELPDTIEELFKNGVDAVPCLGLNKMQAKKRVDQALLNYLERYRMKRRSEYIDTVNLKDWLQKAIEKEDVVENKEFYKKVLKDYHDLVHQVLALHDDKNIDTEHRLKKKLEIDGCVMINCDKNLGMSMFSLETMRQADQTLMEQLGAKKIDMTKDEVHEIVLGRIDKFEESLEQEQKEYLDHVYKDRDLRKCDVKFPFLRSTHKIQKMSMEEIDQKDISNLKFRPVIDAKRWMTRGFATLAMRLMRKAIEELLKMAGPVMGKMKIKNGWRFAKEMQEHEFKDKYGVMLSADIQEAYSNITSEMINRAIESVFSILGYEDWKIDLLKKIIDLVLSNNFVETSTGLYQFKMVLPMGYRLSGEALDIVAVSGEMTKMFNLGVHDDKAIGLPIGELLDYPSEIVDADIEYESNNARGIKNYKRYVDDTHCLLSNDDINKIVDAILAIGYMFPTGLIVNLDLNIFKSEFLDVESWRGIATRSISTMMKRKNNVPFGHVKNGSDHPEKFKMQSLLGEMLRNRRLGSDAEVVEKIDNCIYEDFGSIGYDKGQVKERMNVAKERIKSSYSNVFVKIGGEIDARKFSYSGGIEYNSNYDYQGILSDFIRNCEPECGSKLTLLPGTKLKNIAYTKRRYLERQQEDINNKKKETKRTKKE